MVRNFSRLCKILSVRLCCKEDYCSMRNLEEKIANNSEEHTLGVRMPVNFLAMQSFIYYICLRICFAHICYNSHSDSVEEAFEPFENPSLLVIVYENEEKVESSATHIFKRAKSQLPSLFEHQVEYGSDSYDSKEARCGFA